MVDTKLKKKIKGKIKNKKIRKVVKGAVKLFKKNEYLLPKPTKKRFKTALKSGETLTKKAYERGKVNN